MHPRGGNLKYVILLLGLLVGVLTVVQFVDERASTLDRRSAVDVSADIRIGDVDFLDVGEMDPLSHQDDLLHADNDRNPHRADIPRHLLFADTRALRVSVQIPKPKVTRSSAAPAVHPQLPVSPVVSPEFRHIDSAASTNLRSVVLLI